MLELMKEIRDSIASVSSIEGCEELSTIYDKICKVIADEEDPCDNCTASSVIECEDYRSSGDCIKY